MTEQSANSQDSRLTSWQTPPQAVLAVSEGTTEIRTFKKDLCPECGATVHSHQEKCQACGENLVQPPKQIRCMHCHTTATSELVLCPGCGRELREAPPKLVTMGVPAVLALLLVVILATQWVRISPIAWARTNLVRGVGLVEGISASIEPGVVIIMTPVVQNFAVVAGEGAASAVLAENAASSDMQAVAMAAVVVVTPITEATAVPSEVVAMAVAEESPIGVGGPSSTEESLAVAVSDVPTVVPTVSLPETNTPTPTQTPLPTNTPQPPTATLVPTVAPTTAKAGGIGAALGSSASTPTPTWTVVASNTGSTERTLATATATATSNAAAGVVIASTPANEAVGGMAQVAALAASETTLPTPTLMPTVAVTPLPTPTATPVVYQVRSGDTMVTIASTYGVDVDDLMSANNISDQDVYVIQPGQMLFIPIPTPEAVVAVTNASNLASVRLETPALLVPTNAASISCATGGKLIWQRVQFIKDSDKYVLHLGFINGEPSNGQENVAWILAQNSPVTQTEWTLDTSLCELAPAAFAGQWRWWVEVVEEVDGRPVPVSPPSEIRSFVWR